MHTRRTLPLPPTELIDHSEHLRNRIVARIQSKGPIDFCTYMNLALYDSDFGYYTAGLPKFGEQGDYVTSPEISKLFGYALGNQIADLLSPFREAVILEFGGGSGKLAVDILSRLEQLDQLPTLYTLLETSPALRQRQQAYVHLKVPHLMDRVRWLDRLPDKPINGVILANEVVDAMPTHLLQKTASGDIQERYVDCDAQGAFVWHKAPPKETLLCEKLRGLKNLSRTLPKDYHFEVRTLTAPWIHSVENCLKAGAVMIIDYGHLKEQHYHPERTLGTLMCYYQHRAHDDPFFYPGLQDITADVNFSEVAEASRASTIMYTSQAQFLLNCGILDLAQTAHSTSKESLSESYEVAQQIKRLTLPSEMGEHFKVMALCKQLPEDLTLKGFKGWQLM